MGTNRYAYGMNNPIMLKDPSGNRVSDVGPLGRLGGSEANSASNSLHDNAMSVPGDDIERDVSGAGGSSDSMKDPIWKEAQCKICRPRIGPMVGQDPHYGGLTPEEVNNLEGELRGLVTLSNPIVQLQILYNKATTEGEIGGDSTKQGSAGVDRTGKDFTQKTKKEIDAENAAQNDGVNRCANCGIEVVPAKKHKRGEKPPANERHRDHIIPKSKGGDGTPKNGQILCRTCNLDKSNK